MCVNCVNKKRKEMNELSEFLYNHMVTIRADMLMDVYRLLINLGYVDHEQEIIKQLNRQDDTENYVIVMAIEGHLIHSVKRLLLNYYIICSDTTELINLYHLLWMLDYFENTIESETIMEYSDENLDSKEQFIRWTELFRPDIKDELDFIIYDIRPTLIDNIRELHSQRQGMEFNEPDQKYLDKISRLKLFREKILSERNLAVTLVKANVIKRLYSLDEIYTKFSADIYKDDINNVVNVATNIIGLVILSDGDIANLTTDAKKLSERLFTDIEYSMKVNNEIEKFMNKAQELCVTMNTF